jgi:hypothetical protein
MGRFSSMHVQAEAIGRRKILLKKIVVAVFAVALAWFVVSTAKWPLAGDATYMHYVVFLSGHGKVPYRDIIEINMPFTYLLERCVMNVFGAGAFGWRLFDLSLLALGIWSCRSILQPVSRYAGAFAGVLFALIHGQDGVMMTGERDLVVAVFEITAVACVLEGMKRYDSRGSGINPSQRSNHLWLFLGGLLAGASVAIKPFAILFAAILFGWTFMAVQDRSRRLSTWLSMTAGAILPLLISFGYLASMGAVSSFWMVARGLIAYHAEIYRKPIPYLLSHAFSPIALLALVYFLVLALEARVRRSSVDRLLALCAIAGLLSYVLQAKGFPYQRYPFLIFLLPLIASTLFSFPAEGARLARYARYFLLIAGTGMAVLFAYRTSRYSHAEPYAQLRSDITSARTASGDDSVQCMDTGGGCIGALYSLRLVQSTGFLYDCYFHDGSSRVAQALRNQFEAQFLKQPPQLLILTDSVCFEPARTFDKYPDWQWFNDELRTHYVLAEERHFKQPVRYWSRADVLPGYRIYRWTN